MLRNYTRAQRDILAELTGLYERYAVGGKLTLAEMTRYNRLTKMEAQIAEILKPYAVNVNRDIQRLTSAQYEESFYRAGWSYDNELRTSLGWGQIPTEQVKAAVANPLRATAVKELSEQALNRVNRAVQQGLIRGLSLPKVMREIRDAAGITASQAMRIARTEAHRSRELGHLAASHQAVDKGVALWRVWDATLDMNTRPSHAALDGERARVGENFRNGPELPGQWGIASEDINCRCHATDEIEGYEPVGRRIRGEGVQPYKTFREWAGERGITGNRYGKAYNFL